MRLAEHFAAFFAALDMRRPRPKVERLSPRRSQASSSVRSSKREGLAAGQCLPRKLMPGGGARVGSVHGGGRV